MMQMTLKEFSDHFQQDLNDPASILIAIEETIRIMKEEHNTHKQPPGGVLKKRCSENMQQIYRRTPMPKCDFNKVALQLY